MQTQSSAGFYGKLPCKGDFLQRHVSQEFVDAWDSWLQQCLVSSRQQLQEGWLDAYLTSPVWRFALSDGVCGSGAYAGVMLPSVDRVGRYFPFTLVAQLNTQDCLLEVAGDAGRTWFDSAEALALGALQAHDLDLTALDEQVMALATPSSEPQVTESAYLRELMQNSPFARKPGQWQVPLSSVHSVQRAANVLASRELERALRPLALWWTDGSDLIAPCWLCSRGLPSPASFAAMIAGHWESSGWESLGPPIAAVAAPVSIAAAPVLEQTPQPVEITARHVAVNRRHDAVSRVYVVSRPDLGLWGVVCSEGYEARSAAAAQTMADALQDISAAGSLPSLMEEVRRTLEAVGQQAGVAAGTLGAAGAPMGVGVVAFFRRANECAVVQAGQAQAIRVRSGAVATIEGEAQTGQTSDEVLQRPSSATADVSLLELLSAPSVMPVSSDPVLVHYDTLLQGDVWLLAGARLFDAGQLATLPSLLAERVDDTTLTAIQHLCGREAGFDGDGLPLMLLAAAPSPAQ